MTPAARMLKCRSGATAVEFALIAFPLVMLVLGLLQFVIYCYLQQTVSDALYQTASDPEPELLTQDKSGYTAKFCARIAFSENCLSQTTGIKIEAMKLPNVPTAATAITGSTFDTGASQDVILLRATMAAPRIIPLIPELVAKDSVIFRR
ncbi:TadE family protein [Methylobacterium sp. SyP6R]|uniref:TadE family protein n=1 Tax=Methylobacterium sp. SyP6R TaxID=2718876 RepID=UPI001F363197|nr:TadE family protein [Methylobacterium sp. SyP6R]MCF4125722.1 pilus assembly protein [Methylobacterium sp. SyP6R]